MTKKIKDICVKEGSYEKDGKTKNRYLNVGHVLKMADGGEIYLLKKSFNPGGINQTDGRDTIILSIFDVKDGTTNGVHGDIPQSNPLEDQSIPF